MSARTDERLIVYIAGYVGWEVLLKSHCEICRKLLLISKSETQHLNAVKLTQLKEKRRLLYLSGFFNVFFRTLRTFSQLQVVSARMS